MKNKIETRIYYQVVHLNEDGDRSGYFANEAAETEEEARQIAKDKRVIKNPDARAEDRAYWAKQNYGIRRVTEVTEWIGAA